MASQELNQALWGAANVMRSTMSADEYKDYDATVMNPPYSQHWSAAAGFLTDPRFLIKVLQEG